MDSDMSVGHDHNHDHSHHDAMAMSDTTTPTPSMPHAMSHDHTGVARRPDGTYYYTHGGFLGHILPGYFFIIWGIWWLIATFYLYLRAAATRRNTFKSRAWYPLFFGPSWMQRFPLEPIIKIILPFIGILGEVWLGHESWRTLYAPDGRFIVDHINNWQHSAMYFAFIISGSLDIIGHVSDLPFGIEQVYLGLAFVVEALLLVFHLKGPLIEILLHLILVIQVFATVLAICVEGIVPSSVVAAAARPCLTILQGVWWIQTAYVMFVSNPAYDPEEMGGAMMVPVLFVMHLLWISTAAVLLLLIMRMIQSRFMGKDIAFTPLRTHETEMHAEHGNTNYDGAMTTRLYENGENNRNVELTGLAYQK